EAGSELGQAGALARGTGAADRRGRGHGGGGIGGVDPGERAARAVGADGGGLCDGSGRSGNSGDRVAACKSGISGVSWLSTSSAGRPRPTSSVWSFLPRSHPAKAERTPRGSRTKEGLVRRRGPLSCSRPDLGSSGPVGMLARFAVPPPWESTHGPFMGRFSSAIDTRPPATDGPWP